MSLALQGSLGREEEILDELLGERAAPLPNSPARRLASSAPADAPHVDSGMRLKALILDGNDGVDKVGGEVFEFDEFALLPIGSIVGAELFRFDQHRTQCAARGQFENFFDETVANPKDDVARGLGSRRMLEGPKVSADSMFLPGVLPLLNGSVAAASRYPSRTKAPRRSASSMSKPG